MKNETSKLIFHFAFLATGPKSYPSQAFSPLSVGRHPKVGSDPFKKKKKTPHHEALDTGKSLDTA